MDPRRAPNRKHPLHLPSLAIHNCPKIHFVTICTQKREKILADEEASQILINAWIEADSFRVGRYVIMPDHLHLFCSSAIEEDNSLTRWVSYWKSITARRWKAKAPGKLWQKNFWDTQLLKGDSYDAKWEYVRLNAVRHKLVAQASEWPYQGELCKLEW